MQDNITYEIVKSCVIPYRFSEGKLEMLMVTSIKKQKWIFPKGYIEFNLSAFESAKKEAYEEAGVVGENETVELGSFVLKKKNEAALIKVFSMQVTKELKDYPEKNLRKRKWFSSDEAELATENTDLKTLVNRLKQNLNNPGHNPA